MIRLLKWLIFGDAHLHKWVDKDTLTSFKVNMITKEKTEIGTVYIKECEHCGVIEIFKV